MDCTHNVAHALGPGNVQEAIRPNPKAGENLERLLNACEALAAYLGMSVAEIDLREDFIHRIA
jgi:hypothetical protein